VRRICSEKAEFFIHASHLIDYFIERGYKRDELLKTLDEVSKISREDLLVENNSVNEDSRVIFVSDYHPALKQLPAILKKHYHILKKDRKLSEIFAAPPMVAFRKSRCIKDYLVHSDISNRRKAKVDQLSLKTVPCNRCKLCKNISNDIPLGKSMQTSGGNCKSKDLIYAAWCTKHLKIYVGQTGIQLNERFSRHRWDIKNRPENCDLAGHFHKDHDLDTDMKVVILQQLKNGNKDLREYYEDRWICRLQSLAPDGINNDIHGYAKEMYSCYQRSSKYARTD